MHTCTYIDTYIHTCIHTYIRTYIRTYVISFTFEGSLKWTVNVFKIFLTMLTYIYIYLAMLQPFPKNFHNKYFNTEGLVPLPQATSYMCL